MLPKIIFDEPTLDFDDTKIKSNLYTDADKFVVYLNQEGLADLKWSLWWIATEAPEGEDIAIWSSSSWREKVPNQGVKIGICEIMLATPGRTHADFRLRLEHNRLDLYVTRQMAEDAFAAAQCLGFSKSWKQQGEIFATLRIELLDDGLWSKVR